MDDICEAKNSIQRFLVVKQRSRGTEDPSESISIKGDHWIAKKIYVSDICIAVLIVPAKEYAEKRENSDGMTVKEELNALLRSISNLAMEHNLLRPVAGVIWEKDLQDHNFEEKDYKTWESDQDWHRGAFTLYLVPWSEKNKKCVFELLKDLLDPMVEPLNAERKEPRDMGELIRNAFADVLRRGDYEDSRSSFAELENILIEASESEEEKEDGYYDKTFGSWISRIRQV